MALEASGATVVPVGTGQSRRLLELIPQLGITAIFGTLSFPAYLAARAREAGVDPRELHLRHIVTAGEPGAGLEAVRSEIEAAWGATVSDSFGMSDVWSTMAGACGEGEGLHLTVGEHALLELVDPDSGESDPARGRRERRARVDPPQARGVPASPLPLGRPRPSVDVAVRLRPQFAADPHRRPPRRHAAGPGCERLPAGHQRDPRSGVGPRPPLRRGGGRPGGATSAPVRGGARGPRSHRRSASASMPRCAPASRSRGSSRGRCPWPSTRPASSIAPPAGTRCRTQSRPC